MFFKKKRVTFDKAAKFNYELDTNEALKGTLLKLSLSHNKMKKEEYLSERLFREEGVDLTLKELDMLLLLRCKTNQLLLENADAAERKHS